MLSRFPKKLPITHLVDYVTGYSLDVSFHEGKLDTAYKEQRINWSALVIVTKRFTATYPKAMKYVLRNRSEILQFPRKRDAFGQPSESQFSKMACKILGEHLVINKVRISV